MPNLACQSTFFLLSSSDLFDPNPYIDSRYCPFPPLIFFQTFFVWLQAFATPFLSAPKMNLSSFCAKHWNTVLVFLFSFGCGSKFSSMCYFFCSRKFWSSLFWFGKSWLGWWLFSFIQVCEVLFPVVFFDLCRCSLLLLCVIFLVETWWICVGIQICFFVRDCYSLLWVLSFWCVCFVNMCLLCYALFQGTVKYVSYNRSGWLMECLDYYWSSWAFVESHVMVVAFLVGEAVSCSGDFGWSKCCCFTVFIAGLLFIMAMLLCNLLLAIFRYVMLYLVKDACFLGWCFCCLSGELIPCQIMWCSDVAVSCGVTGS